MQTLSFPLLSLALASLLCSAILCLRLRHPRRVAMLGSGVAASCLIAALLQVQANGGQPWLDPLAPWLEADVLDAAPMVFFSLLTLISVAMMPRIDAQPRLLASLLLVAFGSQMSYAAAHLGALALSWWICLLPLALGWMGRFKGWRGLLLLQAAAAATLSVVVLALPEVGMSSIPLAARWVFDLLLLAVVLRKGLFPLHGWLVQAFEHGPVAVLALGFNAHLGALLMTRVEATALTGTEKIALDWLSVAAMLTALISSLRACAEGKPRRLLGQLCISQASFILAGISTANAQGIAGGLLHWWVVGAASTVLWSVLRSLEVRCPEVASGRDFLGLATPAPRLAVFFLLAGLALIGLPGTLGYCAEDLVFHGALENHAWMGVALPVATALNAIHLMCLFCRLFLGRPVAQTAAIADALPRERWALLPLVLLLLIGGWLPRGVIAMRHEAAVEMQRALGLAESAAILETR